MCVCWTRNELHTLVRLFARLVATLCRVSLCELFYIYCMLRGFFKKSTIPLTMASVAAIVSGQSFMWFIPSAVIPLGNQGL